MTTAATILYDLAGQPPIAHVVMRDACWLCGRVVERGVDRLRWEGANFTSQSQCRAPGASLVCVPCVYVCSWVPPPGHPGTAESKARPPMLRQFSHLWSEDGGYIYAHKGQKAEMRTWLRAAPKSGRWFCAIADSGKKHLLPWTPVNDGPSGRVRFEEATLWLPLPDAAEWALVDDATRLLTRGVTKAEIEPGEYRINSWADDATALLIRDFEARWSARRGGPWFALALWLAQRDETEHAAIAAARKESDGQRKGHGRDGAATPGAQGRLSRRRGTAAPALGADARPGTSGGTDDGDSARMDDEAATRSPRRKDGQLPLFRDGGTG